MATADRCALSALPVSLLLSISNFRCVTHRSLQPKNWRKINPRATHTQHSHTGVLQSFTRCISGGSFTNQTEKATAHARAADGAGVGEERIGLGVGAPVARDGGEFADDQAFDVGAIGFVIAFGGSVVADLGVGEDYDLAGIGRTGEYFLIAGEGGVENNFTRALGGRTKAPALEDASVFQGEDCRVQFRLVLREWITFILAGLGVGSTMGSFGDV